MIMNNIKNKPNYKNAEENAREFLKYLKVNRFPFDLKFLLQKFTPTLKIIPYSKWMNDFHLSYFKVINLLGSSDGASVFDGNKYIVFYNDFIFNKERIRWTITHELGHIILGHCDNKRTILVRSKLTDGEYNIYELEANTFAREFLAPMSLVYYIYDCFGNNADIGSIFGLSHEAAQNILKKMFAWSKNGHDYAKDTCLYAQFHDFLHARYCDNCKTSFVTDNKNKKYCHICGHKLNFGYGGYKNKMKYQDYDVNKNHQLLKCIKCDNEDIDFDNERYAYCHICGAPVINRCLDDNNCGKIAPANARFCPYCGAKTLFYKAELLKPWNEEYEEVSTPSFGSTEPLEIMPF